MTISHQKARKLCSGYTWRFVQRGFTVASRCRRFLIYKATKYHVKRAS